MNSMFIDILKKLTAEQGKEALLNPAKCKALLADYTKGEYKKESRLLLQAIDAGVQKEIIATAELELCKRQQIRVLQEEHFLSAEAAADIVETLALVLKEEQAPQGAPPRGPFCSNCGKELQKEWASCPYCSTPVVKIQQSPPKVEAPQTPLQNPTPVFAAQTAIPANFVRVEGGTFQMGTPSGGKNNERPVHTVTVKSFYIGRYEVTQKEWYEVMWNNPSEFKGENLPVEKVSWFDAIEYCNRRSIREGLTPAYSGSGDNITCDWNANGYRLPTEAEWEYAAKGGNGSPGNYTYSGSNTIGDVAWYGDNSGGRTHPVGTKAANSLGIHDMSGNVYEWCWDRYGGYSSGSQNDPRGASSGADRVVRGGDWYSIAGYVRSAGRYYNTPSSRYIGLGFRLVRPSLV